MTFLIELHLGDVLKVILVADFCLFFLLNRKLVDKYERKEVTVQKHNFKTFSDKFNQKRRFSGPVTSCPFVFYKILRSSNFFCRAPPRWCSRGSPGGWIKMSYLQFYNNIFVDKCHWKTKKKRFIEVSKNFRFWKLCSYK